MMIEVPVVLIFLFSLWVFGRSLILACRLDDSDWLAMPIGLCLVGLVSNILYFTVGLSAQLIQLVFLSILIPCLVMVLQRGVPRCEWSRLLSVLGVFLLLALPAFIGGEQYYVFRGNHWDQFNYINQALTLWDNPFSVYHHALASHFLAKDILVHGMPFIQYRPAVGLVLALLLPGGQGNIHLLAFLYVTALWALVFPALCFAWKRVLEAYDRGTDHFLILIGPAFAYTIGFWGQYIFDINAWSQVASLPLLLAFVFQYIRLLQYLVDPSAYKGKSIASQYIVTGLLVAGAFLFYPENTVIHTGLLLGATVLWYVITRKVPQFTVFVSLVVFSIAVLLISSLPYWNGTAGFLMFQVKNVSAGQGTNYWRYFDRYWLGIHGNVLFSQIKPAVVHGLSVRTCFDHYWAGVHIPRWLGYISTGANFILALTGMFFITPNYDVPFLLRYSWIFITIILAIAAVYHLAVNFLPRFKDNQTAVFLKGFFLSGILFLLYLLKKKALWTFGKALSFLSPYLFLVLCLGLFVRSNSFGDRLIKMFIIVFIIFQIVFGMYRLWSARDPNGIAYDNLTYPSIEDTAMKTTYRWDRDPGMYTHCQGIDLDGGISPLGAVTKKAFSDDHLDADAVWGELIERGYIDPQGVIQAKFEGLKDSSDMILSRMYDSQKEQIYAILQEASFYLEYMKQKFIYLQIPYFSSLPVMSYYNQGDQVGRQLPIVTDCKMGITQVSDKWETVKL